jgi:hypothetical protein
MRHFSTDAFNSVLIAQPILRGPHAVPIGATHVNANKNKKKKGNEKTTTKKQAKRKHHVTQEAFSPTIHCCYRTVIRGAGYGTLCARRPRRR